MIALGDFIMGVLGLVAPDEMTRDQTWDWPEQEAVGQMSVLQYTGKSPDTLQIPGYIYPGEFGMYRSLDTLRDMANAGKPYLMVDIDGWVHGKWVITKLQEKRSHHLPTYTPRKIEFDLGLKRYG